MHTNTTMQTRSGKTYNATASSSKGKNNKAGAFFHKLLPELSNLGIKLLADDDPSEVN